MKKTAHASRRIYTYMPGFLYFPCKAERSGSKRAPSCPGFLLDHPAHNPCTVPSSGVRASFVHDTAVLVQHGNRIERMRREPRHRSTDR